MRIAVLLLLAAAVVGCRGSSPSSPAPSPSIVTPDATPTPDPRASVFDLRTLTRVYDINGTGRVPLGLANSLGIVSANARFKGFYVSEDLPQNMFLHLSLSLGAARPDVSDDNGRTHVAYEWWFATTAAVDDLSIEQATPAVRIALRETDAGRALYIDRGEGWVALPNDTFAVGEYEVSARVRVDERWGIKQTESTFFRAVTRVDDPFVFGSGTADAGDVYPADLSWNHVLRY